MMYKTSFCSRCGGMSELVHVWWGESSPQGIWEHWQYVRIRCGQVEEKKRNVTESPWKPDENIGVERE